MSAVGGTEFGNGQLYVVICFRVHNVACNARVLLSNKDQCLRWVGQSLVMGSCM